MPENVSVDDAYAGVTGLVDDYIGTIKSAVFTYDSEYNNGNTLICRIETTMEDGGENVFKLSTGSGWDDAEKGQVAKREDGSDPKGFNRSCNYQRFVAAAASTEFGAHMKKAGMPWEAAAWAGEPKFHFGPVQYKDPNGADKTAVVPQEFLGLGSSKGAAKAEASESKPAASNKAAEAKAKAAAAKAKKDAEAAAASGDAEDAGLTQLKVIAAEADTFEEFMERAYGELESADDYEEQIVDEAFYSANHG